MDEVEYRLRDLDVVADQAGRLPSAAELRRRGDRRRTAQRARLAVATFAVVAVVAGGVTAFLGGASDRTSGTPSGSTAPLTPAPSAPATEQSPSASPSAQAPEAPDATAPEIGSARLDHDAGGSYWIWAPPTAAGAKRQLTVGGEDVLDLSRKNKKKPATEWLEFYGQLELIPVAGTKSDYQITSLPNSEEANAFCVTAAEAAFLLEVCDEGDAKQAFTMTGVEGGYTISSKTQGGLYLLAAGRDLVWTAEEDVATVFAMEEFDR